VLVEIPKGHVIWGHTLYLFVAS